MPAGRPTLYKPEYCEKLIEHMAEGLSYEAFAGAVRVSVDTLYQWEKDQPDFSEAKKIGVGVSRIFWEKMGIAGVHAEVFNASVWIFNMKNRFRWRDVQPEERTEFNIESLVLLSHKKNA